MNQSAQNQMRTIVEIAESFGWQALGETRRETVRIWNGGRGSLSTFGGRRRYYIPDTDWRMTIGPRTTCVYRLGNETTSGDMRNYRTIDVAEIGDALKLVKERLEEEDAETG